MVSSSRIAAAASAFIAGASAAAISSRQGDQVAWVVSGQYWDCSNSPCTASFIIDGFAPQSSGVPNFGVTCTPDYLDTIWVSCLPVDGTEEDFNSLIFARWDETAAGTDDDRSFIVQHIYKDLLDGLYYETKAYVDAFDTAYVLELTGPNLVEGQDNISQAVSVAHPNVMAATATRPNVMATGTAQAAPTVVSEGQPEAMITSAAEADPTLISEDEPEAQETSIAQADPTAVSDDEPQGVTASAAAADPTADSDDAPDALVTSAAQADPTDVSED